MIAFFTSTFSLIIVFQREVNRSPQLYWHSYGEWVPLFSSLVICLPLVLEMESNKSCLWSYQQETSLLLADSQIAPVLLAISNGGTRNECTRKFKQQTRTYSTYKGGEKSVNAERAYTYQRPPKEKYKECFRKIRYGRKKRGTCFLVERSQFSKMLINCLFNC